MAIPGRFLWRGRDSNDPVDFEAELRVPDVPVVGVDNSVAVGVALVMGRAGALPGTPNSLIQAVNNAVAVLLSAKLGG